MCVCVMGVPCVMCDVCDMSVCAQSPIPVSLLQLETTDLDIQNLAVECFLGTHFDTHLDIDIKTLLLSLWIFEIQSICMLLL